MTVSRPGSTRKHAKLRTLAPRVATADLSIAAPPPKRADAELLTAEHRAWRAEVIRRAGGRCQWVTNGERCTKAEPHHRMFADHIEERKDDGARLDPANGQCLCGQHHSLKTARVRAERMARVHRPAEG